MSFWDTITGQGAANASNQAAADTYAKQLAASQGLRSAGDQYATDYGGLAKNYDSYVSSGNSALQRLLGGLGLGGDGGAAFTQAYHALPGYQSGLDTGTKAATSAANAAGISNSGRALKALQRFGSDYEDQRSGDYLSRLAGVAGQGFGATQAQTGVQGQALTGRLNAYTGAGTQDYNSAGTIGQGQVAGEQAKTDAWGNLLKTAGYLGGSYLGGIGKPSGNLNQGQSGYGPIPKLF